MMIHHQDASLADRAVMCSLTEVNGALQTGNATCLWFGTVTLSAAPDFPSALLNFCHCTLLRHLYAEAQSSDAPSFLSQAPPFGRPRAR